VELSREAVAAAPNAHARVFATLYLSATLVEAARYEEAIAVALDGVAHGHLAGVDHSFGGYMDALAAEGLIRLGRWSEVETVLARHVGVDGLPVGAIRLGRARAAPSGGCGSETHVMGAAGFSGPSAPGQRLGECSTHVPNAHRCSRARR
jgi:hypothetical protein